MDSLINIDWLSRYPQYLQLLGVGFLWINLHCTGMCGPIVIGLDLGGHLDREEHGLQTGQSRLRRAGASFIHLACYQIGRSITYAILGALAGGSGLALQAIFQEITRLTGLIFAAIMITAGVLIFWGIKLPLDALGSSQPGRVLSALVKRARASSGLGQKLLLGIILGLLPCMIPVWALGLAASTQSMLHGALIMVLMVWLTSGVIFGIGMAPAIAPPRALHWQRRLFPLFIILSGVWMALISAGANQWIDHWSLGFTLGGKGFVIMFW